MHPLNAAEKQEEQDFNGDSPWWAKLIARYGIATAVALWLIWFITQGIGIDIRAMRAEHQSLAFYARQTCINTAQTEGQRVACIAPVPTVPDTTR